jgi:hypothetical protein
MTMPISIRPLRPYPPYQEVVVTKLRVSLLVSVVLLSACGGAGSGGTTPKPAAPGTSVPAVAGTEQPKDYPKTGPSASPDPYYGY